MAGRKKDKLSVPFLQNMKPYTRPGKEAKFLSDKELTRQKIDRVKSWATFYRKNPAYFVEHYIGLQLYLYQRFMLNMMPRCTEFIAIAARASAKSFLIAVYSITRCILYPGTIIVLASSTKAQAGLIISDKCKMLYEEYPNLKREISNIVTNQNKWEVSFYNGSIIKVVVSGETGRGNRSNITVLEERRLIPTEVIDSILRPFLVSRQPPYMKNPKYADIEELREEPQEIIISSAYYKMYEWYPEIKKFLRNLANGDTTIVAMFFDYLITIKHGIKTKQQMKREMDTLGPISFIIEYGNIPYGSTSTSFYKLKLFNRNIKRSWRPIRESVYNTSKKNVYDIPKLADEMRIVSVDVAMRAGSTNDNTIIACARLLPSRKGWLTEVVYMESHNGKNTNLQALRIKQIYEEFEGDALVLDIKNAGIKFVLLIGDYWVIKSGKKRENPILGKPEWKDVFKKTFTRRAYQMNLYKKNIILARVPDMYWR